MHEEILVIGRHGRRQRRPVQIDAGGSELGSIIVPRTHREPALQQDETTQEGEEREHQHHAFARALRVIRANHGRILESQVERLNEDNQRRCHRSHSAYSWRSASIGSSRAARKAGYQPKIIPTAPEMLKASRTEMGVTIVIMVVSFETV